MNLEGKQAAWITVIITIIFIIIGIVYYVKGNRHNTLDKKQSNEEIQQYKQLVEGTNCNVIYLMSRNLLELKGYYKLSKIHASRSFNASLGACILGAIIYMISICVNENVELLNLICGSIIEGISALFFYLYKKSIEQLNIYHQRLEITEKYLISIQLIENMSQEKKDESYRHLMESVLCDSREIITRQGNSAKNK